MGGEGRGRTDGVGRGLPLGPGVLVLHRGHQRLLRGHLDLQHREHVVDGRGHVQQVDP